MNEDENIQRHVRSGKARLIRGDGLVLNDVQNVWNEASAERPVDVLLFTVGFSKFLLLIDTYIEKLIHSGISWKAIIPSDEGFCHNSTEPCLPMPVERLVRDAKDQPSSKNYHFIHSRKHQIIAQASIFDVESALWLPHPVSYKRQARHGAHHISLCWMEMEPV